MRIVNFNSPNTWIAWKKTYIDDLNLKITSLWNYMMWHNPPFHVLNSVNQDTPIVLDDEGYRIEVSSEDGQIKFHVYIPSKLQYHQGFYNDSPHGDAVLGYLDSTGNLHLISDPTLTINKGQDEDEYKVENSYQIPELDFPSGYVCISNIQPEGSNNEYNELRYDIANYLIYPLGNGSYFDLSAHRDNWVAQYKQNDMDNYADRMLINLSPVIRYGITANNEISTVGTWNSLNVGITSKNTDYDPYIQDIDGNIWTGKEDLVLEVYNNNNELVICDSKTTITQEVQYQTITHRVLLTSNIKKSGYVVHSI